jgi:hypothetical protein
MRTASMKRLLTSPIIAVVAGLALRLFFVFRFPAATGDTIVYEQLAENWLRRGVYGMFVAGRLLPVDIRMPGYPAYLAIVYWISGHTGAAARTLVMLGQVAVDLGTAALVVSLAARLLPDAIEERLNARKKAVWLAFTCPVVANYAAVPLTEVFATLLTVAALLFFVLQSQSAGDAETSVAGAAENKSPLGARFSPRILGAAGALLAGIGTLFRPETPLLLVLPCAVLGYRLLPKRQATRWVSSVGLMTVACVVPLLPWMIRNAVRLHEFQPLAPRYAQLPGELVTRGFIAWEKTWLWRFRDVYLASWKLDDEPIAITDIPASAFDTPEEKMRVAAVLTEYNENTTFTAEQDAVFAALARERTARHPLRTYLQIPFARAASMWFTPRIELLPFSGRVFPIARSYSEDPKDFCVTAVFFFLNVFYILLAGWGAIHLWRSSRAARSAVLLLVGYVLVRTAFLTTVETPEPRYVIECFPVLLALAAHAGSLRIKRA